MPDRQFTEFHPQNDRDLLVFIVSQNRSMNDGIIEIRQAQQTVAEKIGAMSLMVDRHDNRIAGLEQAGTRRDGKMDSMCQQIENVEKDVLGRIGRLEKERIDPIEDKLNSVRAWIVGAVAVISFLWIVLAPVYTRLLDRWFG